MKNVVEHLRTNGLSYDVIASSCGESFVNVINYAEAEGDLSESVLEKLRRLDTALFRVERDPKEVANIYETHVVSAEHDDKTIWLSLHEIWAFGLVSDDGLTDYIGSLDSAYRVEDMAVDETGVVGVDVEDNEDVSHAEPHQFRAFHSKFRELSAR